MRRWLLLIVGAGVAAGALFYLKREPIVLDVMALRLPKAPLAEREALLEPAIQFRPPTNGSPPYPAVIQFHGCAGMRQNFMDQWAQVANGAGYMAVIVDSNAPRGIDRARGLASVCAGKELIGQERAGDVLAAYEIVRRRSDVDPAKIVLAGWSHGGWSVMDFIAMDPPRKLPAGIVREGAGRIAPAIAAAILVYPYCGEGAWSRLRRWPEGTRALAFIAAADTVVDPTECPSVIAKLNRRGAAIEMKVFDGAEHVFDDPFLAPEDQHLYSEAAHKEAAARYRAFLQEIAGGATGDLPTD